MRYNCSHGFFHRDVLYPDGSKDKQHIIIETLEAAVNYAEHDINGSTLEFIEKDFVKKEMKKFDKQKTKATC